MRRPQQDDLGQALAVYQMFNQGQAQQHGGLDQVLGLIQNQQASQDRSRSLDIEQQRNDESAAFRRDLLNSKDKTQNLDPSTIQVLVQQYKSGSPEQKTTARYLLPPELVAQLDQGDLKHRYDLGLASDQEIAQAGFQPYGAKQVSAQQASKPPVTSDFFKESNPQMSNSNDNPDLQRRTQDDYQSSWGGMAPVIDKSTHGLNDLLFSIFGSNAPQIPASDLKGVSRNRVLVQQSTKQ